MQLVIKNTYSCPNISHVLCQSLLNKYEFFKVCKFCQMLCFILKFYYNLKSYQNMLTTLGFCFLYHKLQLCYVCHAHYTPFTCGKGLLTFNFFEKYLEFLFFEKFHIFLIVNVFLNLGSYYHLIILLLKFTSSIFPT